MAAKKSFLSTVTPSCKVASRTSFCRNVVCTGSKLTGFSLWCNGGADILEIEADGYSTFESLQKEFALQCKTVPRGPTANTSDGELPQTAPVKSALVPLVIGLQLEPL